MNRHLFIAPADIRSPRWQQAFPSALVAEDSSLIARAQCNFVWMLVRNEQDFFSFSAATSSGKKVIALTLGESVEQARAVLEAGAVGYVHYLAAVEVLEQVAMVVAAGGMWLGADLMRQLVLATNRSLAAVQSSSSSATKVDLSSLTSRELAVANLVAAGKTNKEVARELDITERTVKAHLGSTFEKLKARDRLHLVLMLAAK